MVASRGNTAVLTRIGCRWWWRRSGRSRRHFGRKFRYVGSSGCSGDFVSTRTGKVRRNWLAVEVSTTPHLGRMFRYNSSSNSILGVTAASTRSKGGREGDLREREKVLSPKPALVFNLYNSC